MLNLQEQQEPGCAPPADWVRQEWIIDSLISQEQPAYFSPCLVQRANYRFPARCGSSGDADLYVASVNYYESTGAFQCSSTSLTSEELCLRDLQPLEAASEYIIVVYAWISFTDLRVTYRYR